MLDAVAVRKIRLARGTALRDAGMSSLVHVIDIPGLNKTLSQGAGIVQLLLDHGKLRPPDIMSRLAPQGSKGPSVTVGLPPLP